MMAAQARDTSKIMDCGKPMITGARACALSRRAQHAPIAGRSKAALRNAQDWLLGHARRLMAYTALILGAYLAVSGLVHLT
jgi:hypothetical protein